MGWFNSIFNDLGGVGGPLDKGLLHPDILIGFASDNAGDGYSYHIAGSESYYAYSATEALCGLLKPKKLLLLATPQSVSRFTADSVKRMGIEVEVVKVEGDLSNGEDLVAICQSIAGYCKGRVVIDITHAPRSLTFLTIPTVMSASADFTIEGIYYGDVSIEDKFGRRPLVDLAAVLV